MRAPPTQWLVPSRYSPLELSSTPPVPSSEPLAQGPDGSVLVLGPCRVEITALLLELSSTPPFPSSEPLAQGPDGSVLVLGTCRVEITALQLGATEP